MVLDAPVKRKSSRRVFVVDGPIPLNQDKIYDYCKKGLQKSSLTSSTSAEKLIDVAHDVKVRSLKRKRRSQETTKEKDAIINQNRSEDANEEADQIARANLLLSALDEYSQDHGTSSSKLHASKSSKSSHQTLSSKVSENRGDLSLLNVEKNNFRYRERRHYTDMELNFEDYTPSPAAQRALVKGIGLAREKEKARRDDVPRKLDFIEILNLDFVYQSQV